MDDETEKGQPPPLPKKKSPAPAMILAFVPSVLLLAVLSFSSAVAAPSAPLLFLVCGVSVVCCFVSSALLFRRNTTLAILCGIIFVVLNAGISIFLGCVALLSGMRF